MRKDMPIGVLVRFTPETDLKAEFNKVKEMNLTSCQLSVWKLCVYTDENAKIVLEDYHGLLDKVEIQKL